MPGSPHYLTTDKEGAAGGSTAMATDEAVDEEVTDTKWFFLVSMTQSFVNAGDSRDRHSSVLVLYG
jgi:hypothetical protein